MVPKKILFCPGIGANGDMFLPIMEELENLSVKFTPIFLDFPRPVSKSESLAEYTRRAFSDHKFKNKKFDMVVGCSFGGMLLQEALKQEIIGNTKTVLICTAHSGRDINSLFYRFSPLFYLLPGFMYRPLQILIAILYPLFRMKESWAGKFARMFLKTDPSVFFIAPIMICSWNTGEDFSPQLSEKTIQFHGTSDPLISYKKLSGRRVPEFPMYKKNHIIFATDYKFIAREIKTFLSKKY